ncbi:MAG TPA: phosphate ABC transporter substrate-binding protein PstS, partial [Microbacterium sp.]|nr:phosphate ABC transporter substrate-binding protein PstS [Microbacterium sp.]
GIFAGQITNWNVEAIASLNDGVELPDLAISPVHRSDDSGTTETFTSYLSAAAPSV